VECKASINLFLPAARAGGKMEHYKQFIGRKYPPFTVEVERGRLRLFAKAVGLLDPVFTDEAAAQNAGYPSLLAPPTFAYSLTMEAGQSFNVLEDMGLPLQKCVHGAQSFKFKKPIFAGDAITGQQTVVNVYSKKAGTLLFIETGISLTNQHQEIVCELHSTVIARF
jgi:acyl dehydratase